MLENASNCIIQGNDFNNTGGYAIWLYLDSNDNVIDSNTAVELGGGLVVMTGSTFSYMEPHLIYDY